MFDYLVRLLDASGDLDTEMVCEYNSDDEVIDAAGALDHPYAIEVWQHDRIVAMFPATTDCFSRTIH